MKIREKLILSFVCIILSAGLIGYFLIGNVAEKALKKCIGGSSVLLTQEVFDKIDRGIYDKIEEWQSYSQNPSMEGWITELSRGFKKLSDVQGYIQQKNQEWISVDQEEITPFMQELIGNELSKELRKKIELYEKKYGYRVYGEVIVTNDYGVNVAQTNKTTDYYQADEEWWQIAKEKGLYVEDVAYEESSGVYSINFNIRIENERGDFLGVMAVAFNIEGVIDMIKELEPSSETTGGVVYYHGLPLTSHFILTTQNGKLIYSTKPSVFLEDVNETILSKFEGKNGHVDYVVAIDKRLEIGQEELFAYARSKGYKDFPGLGWILITHHETKDIFQSVFQLRSITILIIVVSVLLFTLFSFWLSNIIVRPIKELHKGTIAIEEGNLDYRVGTKAKDEIGQLSRAFDKMALSLKTSWAAVDKKVKEQTEEIRQTNQELKKQQGAILNALDDIKKEKENVTKERDKIGIILQNIGDGVFVIDNDYKILIFNKMAVEISGFSAQEVIGKKYDEILKFVHEKNNSVNDEFIKNAMVTGQIETMSNHTVLVRKSGDKVSVADSAAPIMDQRGAIVGCVVVFRDTSRERKIDMMKTEFIGVASHQLKTPLTAIGWLAERLLGGKMGKLPPKQKDYLSDIYNSNKRMIKLVDDLLSVSRLEEGKIRVESKLIQFEEAIGEIIKDQESFIKKCNCRVSFKKPEKKLPLVLFDESLLRQVVNNLLINAIRYSVPNGRILIKLEKRPKDFLLTISDNGIGIPKDKQYRIFEKFFRADNAQKKQTEGTGLGLYITKMIVEMLGGKIWFESEENKGTTFYVSLPLEGMKNRNGGLSVS